MRGILVLAACGAIFANLATHAVEPIGHVEQVEGAAFAEEQGGARRALVLDGSVYLHDRVITGPNSSVQLHLVDGTRMGQGESSEMVLDEYVFNPDQAADNKSTLSLIKGVFRVITDRITKLNPERFKVTTTYGTIGIRGCELGFELGESADDVYIMALHDADRVYVGLKDPPQQLRDPATAFMEIADEGALVSISPHLGLLRRIASERELLDIIHRAPILVGGVPMQEGDSGHLRAARGAGGVNMEEVEPVSAGPTHPSAEELDTQRQMIRIRLQALVDEANLTPDRIPPPDPLPPLAPNDREAPLRYPMVGPHRGLAFASGVGWSWEIWERDITDLIEGVPQTFTTHGVTLGGQALPVSDFGAIAAGATRYHLVGPTGQAGAIVSQSGRSSLVLGSLHMEVTLGMQILPTWLGTFDMNNVGGDSLRFVVPGTIQPGGQLTGVPNTYQLRFNRGHPCKGYADGATSDRRPDPLGAEQSPHWWSRRAVPVSTRRRWARRAGCRGGRFLGVRWENHPY